MSPVSNFKKIDWISPSSFTALKKCPYKIILSDYFQNPLLPYKPTNHLGKIIHECIELIFNGKINTEEQFEKKWKELIQKEENKLRNIGFNFLTPLHKNVSGFHIKKILVKKLIGKEHSKNGHHGNSYLEIWLKSKDELIVGKIDLLYQDNDYSKIIDFKSAQVLNDDGEIKEDYQDQLKLYAYLHKEKFNRYPNDLSIIDVNHNEHRIDFSIEEIERLSIEAKNLLVKINLLIESNAWEELANPCHENCNTCLYKPACEYHWQIETFKSDHPFCDVKGELLSTRKYQNGNVNLRLSYEDKIFVVEGFKKDILETLKEKIGKQIAVYNVMNLEVPDRFKKTDYTTISYDFA